MIEGFPRHIDKLFISNILQTEADMDISIRINPYKQNQARKKVRRQLTKLQKDRKRKNREGQITESIENRITDIKKLHKKLDIGEERLFDVSINIATGAKSKEKLKKSTEKLQSELNKQQLIPGIPYYKMLQAFKTTLPTTKNKIRRHTDTQPRSMPTGATAELFPFAGNNTTLEKKGILLGTNINTGQPFLTDLFNSNNPNWIAVGTSGSGKSFTAKLTASRYTAQGVQTYIIDPHGEYKDTVNNLSGQNIELSVKKDNMINPLDLTGHTLDEKLVSLQEFYQILFEDLSKSQKPKIMKATRKAYEEKGIYKEQPRTWRNNKPPQLRNVHRKLIELRDRETDTAQVRSYNVLIDQLEPYIHGTNSFLDTNTTIEPDSHITNFSIESLPEKMYPELMFIILDYLQSRMKKDQSRKMVIIDEAWELLSSTVGEDDLDESFIFRTVKSSRKYNLSLGLIVQEIDDLVNSRAGKSVLANTSTKMVFKQDRSVVKTVCSQLQLNQKEQTLIKSFGPGNCLFINDDKHAPIQVRASEQEKDLNHTDPGEGFSDSLKPVSNLMGEGFPESDMYLEDDLNPSEIRCLKNNSDWEYSRQPLFRGGKAKKHWVYVPGVEGADHERMVLGYRDWLEEKFGGVELSYNKADIEVQSDDRLIGVEVETGSNFKHSRSDLDVKKRQNDERYDDWFFVVLDLDLKDNYEDIHDAVIRTEFKDKIQELL